MDRYGAATPTSIPAMATNQDAVVAANANLVLMGYSAKGVAGTAAFEFINNAAGTASGTVFGVQVAPAGMASEWFGPGGIEMASGISVKVTAGTCHLTVFHAVKR